MEIEFRCSDCRSVQQHDELEKAIVCTSCGRTYAPQGFFKEQIVIEHCVICRCRDLYTQKDFNRKVGCAIALIGAILAPFTKLISLFVCAAIDLILYLALPVITICYRCGAIYRGFPKNPAHDAFNLGINDRYRAETR